MSARFLESRRRAGHVGPSAAEAAEFDEIRAELARSETPAALVVIALLVMLLSGVNFLMSPASAPEFHVVDAAAGTVLLTVGLVLRRPAVRPATARWAFAACLVLLSASLLVQTWLDQSINAGYVLILLCMFGPLVLGWLPFAAGSLAITVGVGVATAPRPASETVEWVFLAVCAAMAGAVLLQVRMRSMRTLAAAVVRAHDAATTDPLTEALNRRGLDDRLASFSAMARRLRQPVSVYFLDVDGLKEANDAHGHAFGDRVLEGVATALRDTVREGDLIARWGGDEFVVVGMGAVRDPSVFADRLRCSIHAGFADHECRDRTVSVGLACGDLDTITIEELVVTADADMYARRRESREGRTTG